MKKTVQVNDFNLFVDLVKSTNKIVDSAKFIMSANGLEIYGARNRIARCEVTSNAISTESSLDFCIESLGTFLKTLQTVKDVHENDYSGLKIFVDDNFIKFESSKMKSKLRFCNEAVIQNWISKKVEAKLEPVFEFKTTSELIKRINSHTYVLSDVNNARVYLETKADMEKNSVFASIGNRASANNNEITLKFGAVTNGSIQDGRNIILDLERVNLFNALPTSNIEIALMSANALVSKAKVSGKNNTYFCMNIYNSILKS